MIPGRPVTRRASLSAPSIASEPEFRNITESSGAGNVAAELDREPRDRLGEADRVDRPDQLVDLGVDGGRHPRVGVAERRDRDPVGEVEVRPAVACRTAGGPRRGSTLAGNSARGRASGWPRRGRRSRGGVGRHRSVRAPGLGGRSSIRAASGRRRPATIERHGRLHPDRREPARPAQRAGLRRGRDPPVHPRLGREGRGPSRAVREDGRAGFLGAPIPEAYGGGGMDYIELRASCARSSSAPTPRSASSRASTSASTRSPSSSGGPRSSASAGWCRRRAARSSPRSG